MSNYGFVYVMGHEYMPGVYKIGMTGQSPLRRRDELSSGTAIPCPFDLLFYIEVNDPASVERQMHETFSMTRISENREFFHESIAAIYSEFQRWADEGAPFAMTQHGGNEIAVYQFNLQEKASVEPAENICGGI